jgi:hypothetical protein
MSTIEDHEIQVIVRSGTTDAILKETSVPAHSARVTVFLDDDAAVSELATLRADLKEAAEVLKELWLDSCETMNWTDEFETRVAALLKRLEQP